MRPKINGSIIPILIGIMLILTGCGKKQGQEQPTPTEEVYMPTRSVATVVVPTKVPACTNVMTLAKYLDDNYYGYDEPVIVSPGKTFLQQWEVINYSDCDWNEKYHLFFISGDQMGAPDYVDIPQIPIGSRGIISVELTAPDAPGEYHTEWKLFDSDNRFFGQSLEAEIIVQEPIQNYY